jgi:UDP-N-acetylmuramoylalanine--D-glutamate ligase
VASSLQEAVDRADAIARELLGAAAAAPGSGSGGGGMLATVLLSPAAASFDMFVDYAARGRAFKAAVAGLAERRRTVDVDR